MNVERLMLDRAARRHGALLTGGSPRRIVRLTPAGWRALAALQRGGPRTAASERLAARLCDAGLAHPVPAAVPRAASVPVVVPVRDRPRALERCLAGLAAGGRVVVVDDGSADPGAIAAVAARHGARLLCRERSGGPAAARNAALSGLEGEVVAFIDSDCVPPRDWLERLIGHFDDPRVGAVAPRVRPLGRARPTALDRYLAVRSPLDLGPEPARVSPGTRTAYVPSAALLVRRSALGDGFDPALRFGEDVDLVWRLHDGGWRIRFDPAVEVAHDEPRRLSAALARRYRYGTSAAPLHRRHPGRPAPARLPASQAVAAAALLAGRPGPAAAVLARDAVRFARHTGALGLPAPVAARWHAEALLGTGRMLGRYGATLALPLAVARLRRVPGPVAAAVLAAPFLGEWRDSGVTLDPLRFVALAWADEIAYTAGLTRGAMRERVIGPLLPAIGAERATSLQPRRT